MNIDRILIADDEFLDRELIVRLLERQGISKEQLVVATNGLQAIESALRTKPQLAFLDICMPGSSGLKVLRDLRESNLDTEVVIISAHDEFSYAQEAMQNGAAAYLLKPIQAQAFAEVLAQVKEKMTNKEKQAQELEQLKLQFQRNRPVLCQALLADLVTGNLNHLSDEELFQQIQLLGLTAIPNTVLISRLDGLDPYKNPLQRELAKQAIVERIEQSLEKYQAPIISAPMGGDKIVILLKQEDGDPYASRSQLVTLGEHICSLAMEFNLEMALGIGRTYPVFQQLPSSYQEALIALHFQHKPGNCCRHIDDLEDQVGPVAIASPLLQQIATLIRNGEVASIADALTEFWSILPGADFEQRKLQSLEILGVLFQAAQAAGALKQLDFQRCMKKVADFKTTEELQAWLLQLTTSLSTEVQRQQQGRYRALIARARDFIQANYRELITLEEVARAVNLSPSYFSSLFKQEMGLNFIEYLNVMRIQKAKELLANPLLNISEVSAQVGYNDQSYFGRVFKKLIGVTPSEYREEIGKGIIM